MNPNIHIIRYQDCESSLWKNGGGSTKQLLIAPLGANLNEFDFRISIATILSDGPFSHFNGIDRQLCILAGEGVKLKLQSADLGEPKAIEKIQGQSERILNPNERILRPNDPVFCFRGETQIDSQLLDQQIIDFNVMTKRGKYRAHIERLAFDGSLSLEALKTGNTNYAVNAVNDLSVNNQNANDLNANDPNANNQSANNPNVNNQNANELSANDLSANDQNANNPSVNELSANTKSANAQSAIGQSQLNKQPLQWLLCLGPMTCVYQGKTIPLQQYDMVQYPQALISTALTPQETPQETQAPQALQALTSTALTLEVQSPAIQAATKRTTKRTNATSPTVTSAVTSTECLTLISQKHTQLLHIVIESTEEFGR